MSSPEAVLYLYLVILGGGSYDNPGGFFWSATSYSTATLSRFLYFNAGGVSSQYFYYLKSNGFNIRKATI